MNVKGPTYSDLAASGSKPPVVLSVSSTVATASAKTVVAAPGAGKRIVVLSLHAVGAGTTGAISLKTGADGTIIWQSRAVADVIVNDSPGPGQLVCACGTNELLEIRNDNGGTLSYNVRYMIEAVV